MGDGFRMVSTGRNFLSAAPENLHGDRVVEPIINRAVSCACFDRIIDLALTASTEFVGVW
jgi:hypothetical protein